VAVSTRAERDELARLQEDILYTEKAHFAAADRARLAHLSLGIVATVSSAAAAATIVGDTGPTLPAVLALVGTLASALLTFLKPEQVAQQHLAAGRDLGAIRVQARQVANLDLGRVDDARPVIRDLAEQKAAVDRAAPGVGNRAFERGRKKISSGDFDHDSV
jgi:hypothetical protein